MEIPKDLMEKWEALSAYGDPDKIVESMPEGQKVTTQTVRNALNKGECNPEVFAAIAKFYKEREDRIGPYLKEPIKEEVTK